MDEIEKLVPVNPEEVASGKNPRYRMEDVWPIAVDVLEQLRPHCHRCQIAGSIRRGKDTIGDIEILAIPKTYNWGLFEEGLPEVVNKWKRVKGKLQGDCRNTIRILPCGIKLDLFLVNESNWGYHLAIRTGSAGFSKKKLGWRWRAMGFKGIDGDFTRDGVVIPVREEMDFFRLLEIRWIEPRYREVK